MTKRFAFVVEGVVSEVIEIPGGADISEMFHPNIVASAHSAPAGVSEGWLFDGKKFTPPPAPPSPDLAAYAASKRWAVETGGVLVDGALVATDDRSKTLITGARIKADADPDHVVRWKGADGNFVPISAPQIIALSEAVFSHVDACFAAEADLVAAISSGEITSVAEIDAWPWPGV